MKAYTKKERLTLLKRFVITATCTLTIMGLGASTVLAGEVTGKNKPTAGPDNANSICVFSGQNDDPTAPITLDRTIAPNGPGGRTQNYGQLVQYGLLNPSIVTPGMTCRGDSNTERTR